MKNITKYLCSKCGEEYRSKAHCERHEAKCKAQGCGMCDYSKMFYGMGEGCFLLLIGKDCKFEAKEKTK